MILAECLRSMHPRWNVTAEQSAVLLNKSKVPDIVVLREGGLAVVLESEFLPGSTVEADARARIGQTIADMGDCLDQCVAVVLPKSLRLVAQRDLKDAVEQARYEFVVFTDEGDGELYDKIVR